MFDEDECSLDLATEVLFVIFTRALASIVGDLKTPQDLIKNHKPVVDGGFRVLRWLHLVEPDDQLEFGYKPTSRMIQILVSRGAGPLRSKKEAADIIDQDVVFSILEAARLDLADHELRDSACRLLRAIGLTRITRRGDDVPTVELRELVAEQRDRERIERVFLSLRTKNGTGTGNVVRLPV
jgi:hypothetical protein